MLFAPQWQDSGPSKELYEGAVALRDYFRSICRMQVHEIPIDTSEDLKVEYNIYGYSILYDQLQCIGRELELSGADTVFSLGGGCGIEIPVVSYLAGRHPDLRLFWFDAHGDLNSPETSPSGHFHGMPLRFLTERQGESDIGRSFAVLPTENVVLVGTRDLDPPETEFIERHHLSMIRPDSSCLPSLRSVVAQGSSAACIHIDLDVLDPKQYRNVKCPAKKGLGIETLCEAIETIRSGMELVGLSILENTETDRKAVSLLHELFRHGIDF